MAVKKLSRPSHRGFEGMSRDAAPSADVNIRAIPMDGLLSSIFAPDPVTGMPLSDLHIQLSGSLDPVTQEYIRRTLSRPLPDGSVGSKDPDLVLESARNYNERIDDYVKRLSGMIASDFNSVAK